MGIANGDIVRIAGIEGREFETLGLLGHSPPHLLATMADIAGAEMIAGVEQPPPLVVEDIGALAANDDMRVDARILILEACEIGQEMPQAALRLQPMLKALVDLG